MLNRIIWINQGMMAACLVLAIVLSILGINDLVLVVIGMFFVALINYANGEHLIKEIKEKLNKGD